MRSMYGFEKVVIAHVNGMAATFNATSREGWRHSVNIAERCNCPGRNETAEGEDDIIL